MQVTTPNLSTIIITYNSATDIEHCIRSIERQPGDELIVVDNSSSDLTCAILKRLHDEGEIQNLILRDENVGFARAVNQAIGLTKENTDIFLLNPDAILDAGALDILRAASQKYRDAGILSPLVYSASSVKVTTAGAQPRLFPMAAHYAGLSRLCRETELFRGRYLYVDGKLGKTEKVGWVAGSCMYIKRAALQQIGPLSERWFMYAEDTEYCKRALDNGFDVLLVTDSKCFHAMGQSVKQASDAINVMWPRSLTDYYKTVFRPNPLTFFLWRLTFSLGLISRSWMFRLKAKASSDEQHLRYEAHRFNKFALAVWELND